ncbi:hypothetical protein AAFF_G00222840 [Aldrovandia affinis]|uniref:TATA box-binding protein-associated factor RNA polymerase I subunit B n=1 Tax=Aldrovandia affinis TaxID=143900 RepID=A0AAD7RIB0_9TELE|nr:hypothetical protein AAFF_G00222840 [Aldrovandia affinis]
MMDEEHTRDYRAQCAQCSAVDWGITDEGQFYCRSCHNVIERTQEVVDTSYLVNSRISTVSKKTRNKTKLEHGRDWLVCEGFQFILRQQADALLALGVCPQFKDDVLCNMWRRYLQKSRQAYTRNPVRAGRFRLARPASDSDSAPESLGLSDFSRASESETEGEGPSRPSSASASASASGWSSDGCSSVCSGSLDAGAYSSSRETMTLMTMPRTLALCHLGLLWAREALTLSDLLRFVAEGHVPYINAHQAFPEEMKLYGRDIGVFRVESIPSHQSVQQQAHKMAVFLKLPAFPPITPECLLHPSPLSLRYLMEANLPDELHGWVRKVVKQAGIGQEALLTYDPTGRKAQLGSYDLQAAALIIVTMKLLFKLDDQAEWTLSKEADEENDRENRIFSLLRWYRTVQPVLDLARGREEHSLARQTWKPRKPLYPSKKEKSVVLKRRRVVEQLQANFQKLSGSAPEPQRCPPSSFRFRWGEEEEEGDLDGPSFQNQSLDRALRQSGRKSRLSNPQYWHTALRTCDPWHCGDHFAEVEPTLPGTYAWVLGLFSFLLGVPTARVHAEVCRVEHRLVENKSKRKRKRPPARRERKRKRRRAASSTKTTSA